MAASQTESERQREGLIYGALAYSLWGIFPIYFKLLGPINPLEVLSHRVFWSALLLALVVTLWGRWPALVKALRTGSVMLILLGSTTLIAVNWLVFIYAVNNNMLLQTSFAYFATPLVNVLLGVIFLHERLRRVQSFSFVLAGMGALLMGVALGDWPWVPVALSLSFGFYGLLRKIVAVDGFLSLMIETGILAPLGLGYLTFLQLRGQGQFAQAWNSTHALLLISGLITATPLLLFAAAARRLTLSSLGFMQYIAPILQFSLAVFIYGETFSIAYLASFGLIWVAVVIYTADSVLVFRRRHLQAVADPIELVEEPAA